MWHPDEYLDRLYDQLETERGQRPMLRGESTNRSEVVSAGGTWQQRNAALCGKLESLLGHFPGWSGAEAELSPCLIERVELPEHGLIRERVEYTTALGLQVPAYVLIPEGTSSDRPLPAVLAWHGHGYGSREAVGLLPDGTKRPGEPGIHNDFALKLAKRGMIVIVPEIIGFGDRKLKKELEQDPNAGNSCFSIGAALLLAGKTIAGLRVFEARRAADYAATRSDVDSKRIGTMGFSGGGMVASLFAALDERVKATVLCGYPNTYKSSILARKHCLDNYIPGILELGEMPDLLGLIAPRPLFIESGDEDHLFPVQQVREVIAALTELYEAVGAPDQLSSDIFQGKHEIKGRFSYDWLAAVLKS